MTRPYTVEIERPCCDRCGVGRMWTVSGPDGIAIGISWGEEEGAEEHADALNCAYAVGHAAGALCARVEDSAPRGSRLERAAAAFVDAERARLKSAARFLETGEVADGAAHSKAIDAADDARIELDEARDDEELVVPSALNDDPLRVALRFYANGYHAELPDWEPPDEPNWLCPPSDIEGEEPRTKPWTPNEPPPKRLTVHASLPWMVEDGSIAAMALTGKTIDWEDERPAPIKGEPDYVEPEREPSEEDRK